MSRKGLDPPFCVWGSKPIPLDEWLVGRVLLEFYLSAYLFESFLESLSGSFVYAFLNVSRSSVNDVLSLFQAETGLLFNGFHNLELVSTSALEHYVERGLLLCSLSSCTSSSGTCSNSNSCSSRLNTVLLFQDGCEFIYFLNSKVN